MSQPDHHLPAIRRTVEKREQAHHVAFNLHELGQRDSEAAKSLKPAKKSREVVFDTPVAGHSNTSPVFFVSFYASTWLTYCLG